MELTKCSFSSAIDEEAIIWIADVSDGDARIALGNLEMIMHQEMLSNTVITLDIIKDKIKVCYIQYNYYICILFTFYRNLTCYMIEKVKSITILYLPCISQ